MKFLNLKGVNFFIFCIWSEILIFTLALVMGNLCSNLVFYAFKVWDGKDFYSMGGDTTVGIRLGVMFAIATILQYFFTAFLSRHVKNTLNLALYLVNACAVSCFFMNSLISRTALKNYTLLWLGFFAALMIGSWELIFVNRRFFLSFFRKKGP